MKIKTELLSVAILASLLFIGCGGNARIDEDVSLSSENYITVAKTVYAQHTYYDYTLIRYILPCAPLGA